MSEAEAVGKLALFVRGFRKTMHELLECQKKQGRLFNPYLIRFINIVIRKAERVGMNPSNYQYSKAQADYFDSFLRSNIAEVVHRAEYIKEALRAQKELQGVFAELISHCSDLKQASWACDFVDGSSLEALKEFHNGEMGMKALKDMDKDMDEGNACG